MITNYIPNTCKYSVNNLKKVVHIFSESENVIHIDNGEAYVTSGITDFQTIYATSVEFAESTSYDDRFKFEKTVAVTCDGFLKLNALNEKYYVVLEDENGIMWLVNVDFPSFVTYTYTLADGTDETVFTFNVLSNFPTLKLNATINNSYECKDYSLANVKKLKMNLRENVTIDYKNHILYDSANKPYYIVKFNEGTLKMEESYDGFNVTTTIEFKINFDDYKSSWHYNLLEYQDNRYVAVTDHLACGFEMGLVPSYNVQGSHQIGGGDIVTVTLVGGSQRGSEWAEEWTEATLIPDYIWLLSNEWICDGDIPPVPPTGGTKWIAYYSDSHTESAECDSTSAITLNEITKANLIAVEIGDCVTEIGSGVFGHCTGLTEITIPSGITYIGGAAFYECTGLTGITCEATTPPQLSDHVFHETYCLIYVPCESVDTYKNNMYWSEYARRIQGIPPCGQPTFEGKYQLTLSDSSIVSAECDSTSAVTSGEVATQYSGSVVSAEIGNCVTDIKGYAFYYCSSLTSVTISNNVENINYRAFYGCENLTSCEIGSGVSYLGSGVFFSCTSLTGVTIPSGVTTLRSDTFYNCSNLTYVSLPSGLTSIGNNAFNGCGFRDISLPSGLTSIGDSAFYCCERLSGITIPDSVTSISTYAFQGCSRLTKLKIGTGLTTINSATFSGCTSLIHLEIPDNITRIGNKAFNGCTYLQQIEIGSGVTAIGENAFGGCSRLNNLDIPDNTTTIEGGAFSGCTSLTGVTIGSGVTTIGSYAFSGCSSLTGITINATTPPTLGSAVFNNTNNCPIYVPCESFEAYYTSSNWSGYVDRIEGIPPCVPVLAPKYTLTLNDSSTVSAGCDSTSAMTVPWEYKSLVVSTVIGDCVTSIGRDAFYTCTGLTSITIASTVTEIRYYAFSGCTGLGSITIPNNVTYIGQEAFRYCTGLTSVTIGSSIRHIDINAFEECTSLTSMTIYATTPPKLGNYTSPFNNTNNCPFYVPAASVDAYKSARVWSYFKSRIYPIPES